MSKGSGFGVVSELPIVSPSELVQGVYDESSTQKYALGRKYEEFGKNGKRKTYRYVKNAAVALTQGHLIQGQASLAHATNHTNVALGAAHAAGVTVVTLPDLTTDPTADQFVGGTFHTNETANQGQSYTIIAHTATAGAGNTITLDRPLEEGLGATTDFSLTLPKFTGVIQAPVTTLTGQVLGFAPIDVTASYYFWLQTSGEAAAWGSGTLIVGNPCGYIQVAGAVGPIAAVTDTLVGHVLHVNATTEFSLIDVCFLSE